MPKSNGLVSRTVVDGKHNITVSAKYNKPAGSGSVSVSAGRWGEHLYNHTVYYQLQRYRNYGGGWTTIARGELLLRKGTNKDVHGHIGNVYKNGTQLKLVYNVNREGSRTYYYGELKLNYTDFDRFKQQQKIK